jgi:2'-5' RNA ligase
MRCAAIIEPTFSAPDLAYIEVIRRQYDTERFGWVPPHITLVYPTAYLPPELFLLEISTLSAGFQQFSINFSRALALKNHFSDTWHVYLIPAAGCSECKQLHNIFYSDKLAGQWPKDIPFEPHLCVASLGDAEAQARDLAEEITSEMPSIQGRSESIRIVKVPDPTGDDRLGEATVTPRGSHLVEIGRVVLEPPQTHG